MFCSVHEQNENHDVASLAPTATIAEKHSNAPLATTTSRSSPWTLFGALATESASRPRTSTRPMRAPAARAPCLSTWRRRSTFSRWRPPPCPAGLTCASFDEAPSEQVRLHRERHGEPTSGTTALALFTASPARTSRCATSMVPSSRDQTADEAAPPQQEKPLIADLSIHSDSTAARARRAVCFAACTCALEPIA